MNRLLKTAVLFGFVLDRVELPYLDSVVPYLEATTPYSDYGARARNDFKGTRNNNKPTTTIPVETVQHFNGGILNSRCGISGFVSY